MIAIERLSNLIFSETDITRSMPDSKAVGIAHCVKGTHLRTHLGRSHFISSYLDLVRFINSPIYSILLLYQDICNSSQDKVEI